MLHNIPAELRGLVQWVCSGPDKIPLNPRTGQPASVTDPKTWGSFDEARATGYKNVGFVLTEADPYCIIDLDNKNNLSPEQSELHAKILEAFPSYTERSTGGLGYHIIIRGRVPAGVHTRDKVEVYSTGRYMICTGNVVRQAPIGEFQELLDRLYGEMRPAPVAELDDRIEILEDGEVVEMAMNAVNGDKYTDLCNGKWQEMGYPSQSEADYALLSMLTYYSPSNEQVRRLFRMTALGKRDKATRSNTYIDRCLGKIRATQAAPVVDISALQEQAHKLAGASTVSVSDSHAPTPHDKGSTRGEEPITPPPGLIGEMAAYFYESAVRPVPEVALAAAIGLTAGVAGRTYNVSGTGLNQYLILIAKTGAGKEGAQSGIDNLVAATRPQIPNVDQFVGPGAFASGQALIRVLDERPCFVSILGEFGLTIQQLCDVHAHASQVMLKKVLLDLYSKSGWQKFLRSSVYSDVEKNTKTIQAPNVTILGETTPSALFDGLNSSHIAEGLIPRFSMLEYKGDRPSRNPNANQAPRPELITKFARLVEIALIASNNKVFVPVQTDPHAQRSLDGFDEEADALINRAGNEVEAELWNRAHLKALKLAALVAVGCNYDQPVVTQESASWAIDFVRRDITSVSTRFKTGDVGTGDGKLMHDLKRVIETYYASTYDQVKGYGVERDIWGAKIVPYVYMQRRTNNLSAFRQDRRGSSDALGRTIISLIHTGELVELPSNQMMEKYKCRGKGYMIARAWVK